MNRIVLYEIEKDRLMKIIDQYTAPSRFQSDSDIRIYIDYRYNGYSSYELAEREHMNRVTVYRRIKKVDFFIKSICETNLKNNSE